jgi:hypothetical protein
MPSTIAFTSVSAKALPGLMPAKTEADSTAAKVAHTHFFLIIFPTSSTYFDSKAS